MGADIVKVEEPGRGDYLRWIPPMVGGESAFHAALNRGKRSITLNLKDPAGVDVLRRLVKNADVVVESFRPGVMDRLGVGFGVLSEDNPRLVYCAITGYGQDGPYRDRVGHDINYIGFGGVLGIIGEEGGPPSVPGVQIGDLGAGGMAAAIGILAALLERERTGRGRFVDTAMLDGVVSWLSIHAGNYFATGKEPTRGAIRLSGEFACYRVYRCGDDQYLTVGALEPQFWRALCEKLGVPELVDRQFDEDGRREVIGRLEEIFATRSRDEWIQELAELETCVGPVNEFGETFKDPQVVHRGMIAEIGGQPVGPGSPFRFDGRTYTALRRAPGFGEHSAEVLGEIGVDDDELDRFRASGVV
jgi:crotonobetainyl-CoA:carnitine CoA-transferase CaiB-like acyl-CoA transferase